jgi:serine/threonine protein kinase/Tfp pilus assembly protein PilF
MAAISKSLRICETCGKSTDPTSSGDFGCIVCFLNIGLKPDVVEGHETFAETPERLGAYTIERHADGSAWELGRGAMGVTYRAIDKALDRPVALKIINTNLGSRSAEARERFMREARAEAALRHPNVATVYQFGVREKTGQFFYAMELVEGETLGERVRRLGPLDVLTTIEIALQVTAALQAAEERRLVHRDLKPGNLMLVGCNGEEVGRDRRPAPGLRWADRGRRKGTPQRGVPTVKVIDFGVAKAISEKTNAMALTHGGFVGTPAFASPEQFTDAPVDVRSDIYSLGATLWFLLTGHVLFSGRTIEEIREARRSKPLPIEQLKAARVPHRFVSLLRAMLAMEPVARPTGARELAAKLQAIRDSITGRGKIAVRLALAAVLIAVATVVGIRVFHSASGNTPTIPEKSIAVLPFESFSDDKENAYFADGVQDEILTDLTKVADLKVISRRSVAQYRDTKRSIREIGRALGVVHVLAGSVRKAAGQIHVTVQLIDARNEAETWAEKYDRDVADIFLVQSDISQEIVSRLKAALSPEEKAAIEEKPTQDKEAYDLYLRARALVYEQYDLMGSTQQANATKAIPLLESAITRDPKFALAYCVLGDAQLILLDAVKAKEAIDTALRISPNSAEAHLILARYFIEENGRRTSAPRMSQEDVATGEKELSIAATGLPGRVEVFNLRAEVEEKQGKWKEALRDREKAVELDPRDVDTAESLGELYLMLRWYNDAERLVDHSIAITPEQLGDYDFFWREKSLISLARGDTKAAMAALDANPLRNRGVRGLGYMLANIFIMERDYAKAEEILQSVEETAEARNNLPKIPKAETAAANRVYRHGVALEKLGRIARYRDDKEKARGYFEGARDNFEESLAQNVRDSWFEAHALAYIAEIDAGLGRKEDAIREGRKAVELWPVNRDAVLGQDVATYLAIVYMWSGERDSALEQLANVVRLPALPGLMPVSPAPSAGELKLDPLWDELRNDPRFDKIIAQAAQPIKLE